MAKKGKKCIVVVEGEEGREYKAIGADSLSFSPDSKHVGYSARKGKKWIVVVDGQERPEYQGTGPLWFSPDSKRVAYLARKGRNVFLVEDGEAGPKYNDILYNSLIFQPNGVLEYLAKKENSLYRVKHIPKEKDLNQIILQ